LKHTSGETTMPVALTNSHNPNSNAALEFNQLLRDSTQTTMLYTTHFLTRKPKGALFQRGPSCSTTRGDLSQEAIKPYSLHRNSFASSLSRYTAGDWLANREAALSTPNAQLNAAANDPTAMPYLGGYPNASANYHGGGYRRAPNPTMSFSMRSLTAPVGVRARRLPPIQS